MPVVEFEAFVIEPMDPEVFIRNLQPVMDKEARAMDKLYREFYSTWSGEKPNMQKLAEANDSEAFAEVSTRGNSKGNRKLLYLDDGTTERWAVMSNDWRSKTSPGRTRSGPGRGHVKVRGRRYMTRPRPGIKARNISKTIVKIRRPMFRNNVNAALAKSAEEF